MLAHPHIHRRTDGSIDIDFYRQQGLMERRIVLTGFMKGIAKLGPPLAVLTAVAVSLYLMPDVLHAAG